MTDTRIINPYINTYLNTTPDAIEHILNLWKMSVNFEKELDKKNTYAGLLSFAAVHMITFIHACYTDYVNKIKSRTYSGTFDFNQWLPNEDEKKRMN